ncbi:hypothetical protein BC629DRAFT_472926 [Irpex lacteus]|nr:hypothetical protein BC629DRAFT_472926 [Irpex lacteus]
MHTRSQTKRANDATPLVSLAALAAEVKVPSCSLPKASRKTTLTQRAKKRPKRPLAPKVWKDEIARIGIAELAAAKPGRRKGPFLCQCCWKSCRGSYELGRHYGTHLLDKTFRCGNKSCSYKSAQKDNLRTHCRKMNHGFSY